MTKTEQLRELITEMAGGTIFSCRFIKRSTGEVRDMTCRLGVKKYLQGGELPFDPVEKGLLPVYDLQKEDYRMISLSTLQELRIKGKVYRFE